MCIQCTRYNPYFFKAIFILHLFLLWLMESLATVETLSHFLYLYLNLFQSISTSVLFIWISSFLFALFPGLSLTNDLHNSASSICMIPLVELQTFVETLYCSKKACLEKHKPCFNDGGGGGGVLPWSEKTNIKWDVAGSGRLRCEIVMWRLRVLIKPTVTL